VTADSASPTDSWGSGRWCRRAAAPDARGRESPDRRRCGRCGGRQPRIRGRIPRATCGRTRDSWPCARRGRWCSSWFDSVFGTGRRQARQPEGLTSRPQPPFSSTPRLLARNRAASEQRRPPAEAVVSMIPDRPRSTRPSTPPSSGTAPPHPGGTPPSTPSAPRADHLASSRLGLGSACPPDGVRPPTAALQRRRRGGRSGSGGPGPGVCSASVTSRGPVVDRAPAARPGR
jgi:hypothetical protein